ncbi:hypothetical protein FGIG_08234 [Fasciola gigantica]|uniref:BHLH domain-containing protein n=1 Tax=Fasciola gigantica TaxID=46835 RepID=A0A504YL56_FASGI|nr:hypothetical protein FGIG_08234 [Fasciola gigantica]
MHVRRLEESERMENYEHVTSRTGVNRMVPAGRTKPRRPRATMRERQRMAQVNQAFDNLRRVVPRGHMTEYQRLSKIATLRLAIQYIRAMNRILGRTTNLSIERPGLQELRNSEQSGGWTDRQLKWTDSPMELSTTHTSHVNGDCDCVNGEPTVQSETDDNNRKKSWYDFESAEHKTLVLFGYTSDLGWDTVDENHSISGE